MPLEERRHSGSWDRVKASGAPGLPLIDTMICAVVTHERARRNGERNLSRACAGVLPGKWQQHDEPDHVRVAHIELPGVMGALKLLQGHSEPAARPLIQHRPALFTGQLDDAAVGSDRAHACLPWRAPWL